MQKEEIPFAEIERYAPEVLGALDKICESPPFRTSPKSCEFLRHIVRHTLLGTVDELKERLIGITLLGRETTYDTGSDAGVRVRANDVRKRLSTYNADAGSAAELTLDLPAGSYIPRFFRKIETLPVETLPDFLPVSGSAYPSRTHGGAGQFSEAPSELDGAPSLSLWQLAAPSIAALFLCTICLRWQLAQAHPFVTFWQSVLQDHNAILYVPPVQIDGQQDVSMASMNEAAPLLNLAGQFHTRFTLADSQTTPASPTDILVSIGSVATMNVLAQGTISSAPASSQDRLVIENTPSGREIIDRSQSRQHPALANHAALLTIENGPQRSIRIDGTDDAAISSLIQALCERDTFPDELADSLQSGTITQMVFSTMPHAETMVFHEPLSAASAMAAQSK
jgi:hypothetical protein